MAGEKVRAMKPMKPMNLAGMAAVLLVLIACTGTVSAVTLTAGGVNIPHATETGEIPLTLDVAGPAGIAGYSLTITTDPDVATITGVNFPDWTDGDFRSIDRVPNGVTISVVDVKNFLPMGGTPPAGGAYLLGTVLVQGVGKDVTADLEVNVNQMDGDDGTFVNPTVVNGKIGVELTPGSIQVSATDQKTVSTIAGAAVTISGDSRSWTTPCLIGDVIPGVYHLKVSYPNYVTEERDVTVDRGATAPAAFVLWKTGNFKVYSRPSAGAAISVDDKPTNVLTTASVPPSGIITGYDPRKTYKIGIEMVGYSPAWGTFQPLQGLTKSITLTMQKATNEIPGTLRVDSSPQGARVVLNGEDSGSDTPSSFTLNPDTYTVDVILRDYASTGPESVIIAEGDSKDLFFTLQNVAPVPVPEFPAPLLPVCFITGICLLVFIMRTRQGR
jgi:hypothetical protein